MSAPRPWSFSAARQPTNFRASRGVSVAVDAQVAYADVLLVTKAEEAGEAETRRAIEAAHAIAPRAQVLEGSTEQHAAWLEQTLADPDVEHVPSGQPHVHDETCRHPDSHVHGVDSTWLNVEGRIDLEELEDQLAELPANYVRIKGIVRDDNDTWSAVHRVGLRVSSEPLPRQPENIVGENGRIVALGVDLDSEKLANCLRAAYVK